MGSVRMMGARLSVVVALLAFAGCTARVPAATDSTILDVEMGSLRGIVTDDMVQPLTGVIVTLSHRGAVVGTTTSDVGSFGFGGLVFGDYQVDATLAGFLNVSRRVSVASVEATNVTIEMAPVPVDEPYATVDVYAGLIRCGVSAVVFPTTCCNAWDKTMDDLLGVGAPPIPVACPEAIPHDAHVVLFDVPTGHRAFVGETDWDANAAMSALYSINRTHQLASLSGPAILRQELLSDTNTTTASLATLGTVPAPETAFRMGVLLNYVGNLQTETDDAAGVGCRALFSNPCDGIGVATEHRFTHYLTVFMNAVPQDLPQYSALSGT